MSGIYKDITEDVEIRFGTSNFEIPKPLPQGIRRNWTNERCNRCIHHERICCIRTKTYTCIKGKNDEDKNSKDTKMCVIKRKLKFEDYKNCLEAAQIENKVNHSEKNKICIVLKNLQIS